MAGCCTCDLSPSLSCTPGEGGRDPSATSCADILPDSPSNPVLLWCPRPVPAGAKRPPPPASPLGAFRNRSVPSETPRSFPHPLPRFFPEHLGLSGTARVFPDPLGSLRICPDRRRSPAEFGWAWPPLIPFPIFSEALRLFPRTGQGRSAALTSPPAGL